MRTFHSGTSVSSIADRRACTSCYVIFTTAALSPGAGDENVHELNQLPFLLLSFPTAFSFSAEDSAHIPSVDMDELLALQLEEEEKEETQGWLNAPVR